MTTHQHLWPAALAQVWQLAVLVLLMGIAARLLARNRPHLAHALWLVVLLKCLTPPLWNSPTGLFCWLQGTRERAHVTTSAGPTNGDAGYGTVVVIDRGASSAAGSGAGAPVQFYDVEAFSTDPGAPGGAATAVAAAHGQISLRRLTLKHAILLLWLAGSITVVTASGIGWLSCWRRMRRAGSHRDKKLEAVMRRLAPRLRIRRRVRLVVTRSRVGPAVIGVVRPTIVIPATIVAGRSPADLEPILAHELLHVRRGDLWVGLVQVVAQALWWFHPLVWLANRMISREAERCCDEEVLAGLGCEPSRYARSLLDVLERKQSLVAVPAFPGVRPVEITAKRLERIMMLGQGCRRRTPWWCWLVMLAAATIALPGSPFLGAATEPGNAAAPPSDVVDKPTLAAAEPMLTRTYFVGDLLEAAGEQLGTGGEDAKRLIESELKRGGQDEAAWLNAFDETPANPNSEPVIEWLDEMIVVRQSAEQHKQMQAGLDTMRRHRFTEIELEVRLARARGPSKILERFGVDWTTGPGHFIDDGRDAGVSVEQLIQAGFEERPRPRYGVDGTIEKSPPMFVDVIDQRRTDAVIDTIQSCPHANLLRAPNVRVFNARSATIADVSKSRIAVAVVDEEPQYRVVPEGIVMRLSPTLQEDGILVDFELQVSSILSLATIESRTDRSGQRLEIQTPEIFRSRIALPAKLAPGKTLIVGELIETAKDETDELLVMLVTPRLVERKAIKQDAQEEHGEKKVSGVGVNSDAGLTGSVVDTPRPYAVVYRVADLVCTLPNFNDASDRAGTAHPRHSDFEALIDLIKLDVAPRSWGPGDYEGHIEPFPQNLSLVICHTKEVHAEIAALLQELRSLRVVDVDFEVHTIVVAEGDGLELCFPFEAEETGYAILERSAVDGFQTALGDSDAIQCHHYSRPRLRSGQRAFLPFVDIPSALFIKDRGLYLSPIVTPDRSRVMLRVAARRMADMMKDRPFDIRQGQTLLLDVTQTAFGQPSDDVNSAEPTASTDRCYVLITPRIRT